MSIYSDWKCGALTYEEYIAEGRVEVRRDRWEQEHEFDDEEEDPEDDEEEPDDDEEEPEEES